MARLRTTTGRCLANIRMAESDIRLLASTMPSTVDIVRSMAARSTWSDSWASISTVVYSSPIAASCAPRTISAYTGLVMSAMTSAIMCVRAVVSARAKGLVR